MRAWPPVVVSGVHSGVNPSPGLGVARSVRAAWPGAAIEALDYSTESTGAHADLFDAVHIMPRWEHVSLEAHARVVAGLLAARSAVLIPGLDLEAEVLAGARPRPAGLLAPPAEAFEHVRKPAVAAARGLGLAVPPSVVVASPADAEPFVAAHGWRVWVKGGRYEALPVFGLADLVEAMARIRRTWGDRRTLVQAHVEGPEESIAFAALGGDLLGACHMTKTQTTAEGKTWGGRIGELSGADRERLAGFVARTAWSGGGEIEMVREAGTGERHLVDINPRFPAWIHGATIAGINLPAALVAAATGRPWRPSVRPGPAEFVRVVQEIPARFPVGVPESSDGPVPGVPSVGKGHPSGMPSLARRLAAPRPAEAGDPGPVRDPLGEGLGDLLDDAGPTPVRIFLEERLQRRLRLAADVAERAGRAAGVPMRVAYSVKTNPDDRVLKLAREHGLLAECISLPEAQRCVDSGFGSADLVLNGPGKWWHREALAGGLGERRFFAVFADSLYDLDVTRTLLADGWLGTGTLGLRLAPVGFRSRFGVAADLPATYAGAVRRVRDLAGEHRFGVHFHLAPSRIGPDAWLREFKAVAALAAGVSGAAGAGVRVLDLGGGWSPRQLDDGTAGAVLTAAARHAAAAFPALEQLLIEPGKSVVEPAMVVVSSVLDVRRSREETAVVVDASIAELADGTTQLAPVLWRARSAGGWRELPRGGDAVWGRLCMEHDRPRVGLRVPPGLAPGDRLAFLGAGAYDASMSYRFGA
ncbi:hypothetical protein [Dactylosporangium sp. CA-092794]|uniref:hypothetical protein n=1 Tax=Dactylosporangium sp. CA-092794 TaxID=3239929 RepID=UPI003D903DCD